MATWFGACGWCKSEQDCAIAKLSQFEDIQQLSALQAETNRLHEAYLLNEQEIWEPCEDQMFQIREKARRRAAELRAEHALQSLAAAADEVIRPSAEPGYNQLAEWAHQ